MNFHKTSLLLGTAALVLLLLAWIAFRPVPRREEGAEMSAGTESPPRESSRLSALGPTSEKPAPVLRFDRWTADPALIESFLEKYGRDATNLVIAASLRGSDTVAYLKEAYENFPDDPLVIEYMLTVDDMDIDLALSARRAMERRPTEPTGYLLGALAAFEEGRKDDALGLLGRIVTDGLKAEDRLNGLRAGRYRYAREFELMPPARASEVALRSGGIVIGTLDGLAFQRVLEAGKAALETGNRAEADEWFARGLGIQQSVPDPPYLISSVLRATREKAYLERLSPEGAARYLSQPEEGYLEAVQAEIDTGKSQSREFDSMMRNVRTSDYAVFAEILIHQGEPAAYRWLKENTPDAASSR